MFVDESDIITVPDAFGNDTVLSAVGSTTVSVVSCASSVAPSNTIVPSSNTFKLPTLLVVVVVAVKV